MKRSMIGNDVVIVVRIMMTVMETEGKIDLEVEDGVDHESEDVKKGKREILLRIVAVKRIYPIHRMDLNSVEDVPPMVARIRRVQGIVINDEKKRRDDEGHLLVEAVVGVGAEARLQVVKVKIVTL